MSETILEECYICGCTRVELREADDCPYCTYDAGTSWHIWCHQCPEYITRRDKEDVIAAWNNRVELYAVVRKLAASWLVGDAHVRQLIVKARRVVEKLKESLKPDCEACKHNDAVIKRAH